MPVTPTLVCAARCRVAGCALAAALAAALPQTANAPPATAAPPAARSRLIAACRQSYADGTSSPARHLLGDLIPRQVRTQLAPLLRQLAPGSTGYTAVAFVLASYNIDLETNLRHMFLPYKAWQRRRLTDVSALEPLPDALAHVYGATRDSLVLDRMLSLRLDGHFAETLNLRLLEVFLRHPTPVLRAAASGGQLARLVRCLRFESHDPPSAARIRSTLRAKASSPDRVVSRTARTCVERLEFGRQAALR